MGTQLMVKGSPAVADAPVQVVSRISEPSTVSYLFVHGTG